MSKVTKKQAEAECPRCDGSGEIDGYWTCGDPECCGSGLIECPDCAGTGTTTEEPTDE